MLIKQKCPATFARGTAAVVALFACTVLSPVAAQCQTFRTLYGFRSQPDGTAPRGAPVLLNGLLYGTTNNGGLTDQGTVYKINPKTGAEEIIYSFAGGTDGVAPQGDLIQHQAKLFGTTSFGGTFNAGTIFEVDAATGAEQVLYSFGAGQDGASPLAGLLYNRGVLYGTTVFGGASGNGTVFAFDIRKAKETVLHGFAGGTDGSEPFSGVAIENCAVYGTTGLGGTENLGTIFKIDLATGTETVVHTFRGGRGLANPFAGLVANGSVLYGAGARAGKVKCHGSGCGGIFSYDTATNSYATLYLFDGFRDGEDPENTLTYQAGFLYGTTNGGRSERGTLFKVDVASGAETLLHGFEGSKDGAIPSSLIYRAGRFFGTTSQESAAGFGTVFTFHP